MIIGDLIKIDIVVFEYYSTFNLDISALIKTISFEHLGTQKYIIYYHRVLLLYF